MSYGVQKSFADTADVPESKAHFYLRSPLSGILPDFDIVATGSMCVSQTHV